MTSTDHSRVNDVNWLVCSNMTTSTDHCSDSSVLIRMICMAMILCHDSTLILNQIRSEMSGISVVIVSPDVIESDTLLMLHIYGSQTDVSLVFT